MVDVINVKNAPYNAKGDASQDDGPAIQAAFDAAFKPGGVSNGLTNAWKNIPVFIPNGNYIINTPLTLTNVCGGWIFGAGPGATRLGLGTSLTSLLTMSGCSNVIFEKMDVEGANVCSRLIDIDWDGTGKGTSNDGSHNNVFRDLLMSQSLVQHIRIGNSNHECHSNVFDCVTLSNAVIGIDVVGASAVNQAVRSGGGTPSGVLYYARGGSIHVNQASCGNNGQNASAWVMQVDSGLACSITGSRVEENANFIKVTNGTLSARALGMAAGTNFASVSGANARLAIDSCNFGSGALGKIIGGSGAKLWMRGSQTFDASAFTSGGGTIVQNLNL